MSVEEKLLTIKENQPKVFDAAVRKYALKTTSDKSDLIIANKSAEYGLLNMKVYGKSWQETVAGNQLFDENAFTMAYIPLVFDGESWFLENTQTINVYTPNRWIPFEGEAGKQYTLSADLKCGTCDRFGVAFAYAENDWVESNRLSNTDWFSASVTSDINKKVVGIGVVYGADGSGYIRNLMLNEGSTSLPWEPYTGGQASPSPDYPQEIKNLENVEVKVLGKNLFDKNKANDSNNWITCTQNGYIGFVIQGKPNEYYTISATRINSVSSYIAIANNYSEFFDENGNIIAGGADYVQWLLLGDTFTKSVTIQTDDTGKILLINGGNFFTDAISDVQVEIGTVATEYEEYKTEQLLTIPYALCGIGDNRDYVNYERKKLIRKPCEKNLSDFEWTLQGASEIDDGFVYYTYQTNIDLNSLITHFKPIEKSGSWNALSIGECVIKGGYILIGSSCQTVDELKTWFAEKNVNILITLAEPIEIDLTDEDIQAYKALSMYSPTTIISSDADVEVKYIVDPALA